MAVTLTGTICTLSSWRADHSHPLVAIANDLEVSRYLLPSFPSPYRLEDVRIWIELQHRSTVPTHFASDEDRRSRCPTGESVEEVSCKNVVMADSDRATASRPVSLGWTRRARRRNWGFSSSAKASRIAPTHPGDVLREDFLKPLGITPNALSIALRVPASRIADITKGRRAVTAETAIRLARYFGTSREFWMNLQAYYDLACVEDEKATLIEREVQPRIVAVG